MYNQGQQSNRALKQEKDKLEMRKTMLERTTEVTTYLAWGQLPPLEKLRIKNEWIAYYAKVSQTQSFKEFMEMRDAYKENKMARVKELTLKAKKRREDKNFMPKPQDTDPWEFSHGVCGTYQGVCNRIEQISLKLTGVKDVQEIFK